MAPRCPSLAQGYAWVAVLMALVAAGRAAAAAWPQAQMAPTSACADAVAIVVPTARGNASSRLGCASELARLGCPSAQAGDQVTLGPGPPGLPHGACHVQKAGMPAPWMLALGLPLDINQRSASDLRHVPGLGGAVAERIVAYRQEHGPFAHLDELTAVRGIGAKSLRKLMPYLTAKVPSA